MMTTVYVPTESASEKDVDGSTLSQMSGPPAERLCLLVRECAHVTNGGHALAHTLVVTVRSMQGGN